ncbi:MAG: hypothetical protein IJY01_08045 [Clostridia bacterium]|nr:hypothetical protein [Clostridia bacterium]
MQMRTECEAYTAGVEPPPYGKFSQNAIQRAFCRYGDTENSVGLRGEKRKA